MGIGWSEIFVIALVATLVFGPKELPQVLRTAGRMLRQAQSVRRDFERQLRDSLREVEQEVGSADTLRSAPPAAQQHPRGRPASPHPPATPATARQGTGTFGDAAEAASAQDLRPDDPAEAQRQMFGRRTECPA